MIIGIDIGGTSIKAGVVEKDGIVLKLERCKTPKTKDDIVHAVITITQTLLQEYGKEIHGIGIGCPGPLDCKNGIVLNTPNIPKNTDLKTPLQNMFDLPLFFNNDANCFTLAEAVFGEGRDRSVVMGITLGTGFGAGLVINEIIYSGRGNALEIGHTIIHKEEHEQLPNLTKGCVEQYVSTAGVLAAAKKYDLEIKDPIDVFQLAEVKNDKALAVWKEFGWNLGIAVTNGMLAFDPDIIVIGGAMNQAWLYFEETMHSAIEQHCISTACPIVRATVKEAGIVGASLLLR